MGQRLDIDALQTLCAIEDFGGITRASKHLALSQSAVSHKIKRLETGLDCSLLTRRPGAPLLTQDGARLVGFARRILSLHDEALLSLSKRPLVGKIKLGMTEDTTSSDLSRILGRFVRLHPNVSVRTQVRQSLELEESLETGLLHYPSNLATVVLLRSIMPRKSPFKHHRFPREIILCAVRWYLRYPLSYQDVADLLSERGICVDRSTVYRWVTKFGPEITKRTEKYLRRASVDWHVDETYIRVGGRWRYLWRAVDANGQMIDFRLTARRDAEAAKAFLNKAIERVRLHRPVTIVTDKAQSYRRVIREINHRFDPHFDSIRHIDKKWRNNRIESDHAAMKRILGYRQSFRSIRSAKATLSGIETIRTIKRGHIHNKQPGASGEIQFINQLFGTAE